jgi:uncharacterized protein
VRSLFVAAALFLGGIDCWAGPLEDFKAAASALDKGDYNTALRLFRTLAAQDIPGAQFALGTLYFEGKGVTKDYAAALNWHRQAAALGHPLAQYEIGAMYDGGLGLSKDPFEAVKWFRRAAAQGYGMAQVNLGAMYSTGEGVPRDHIEAYKWFSLAAERKGYMDKETIKAEAGRRRDAIASRMTFAQVSEARERARLWKPEIEPAGIAATKRLKGLQ